MKTAVLLGALVSSLCIMPARAQEKIKIDAFYGIYESSQKEIGAPSGSLQKNPPGKPQVYDLGPKASKPFRIGVLFPTFADSYWVSVNCGIYEEAKRLGVYMETKDAHGYAYLDRQRLQFEAMIARDDIDGILLAASSYTALDPLVDRARDRNIPVVAVVNDIYSNSISAKAMIPFLEMGQRVGRFLCQQPRKETTTTIAFFPGPLKSAWAVDGLKGFLMEMSEFPGLYTILPPQWGDTRPEVQRQKVLEVLEQNYHLDYIIGNAVAATEATKILKETGRSQMVKVISTYVNAEVYPLIEQGQILAAPTDRMVEQGRISINMLVRILEGAKPGEDLPFRAGPLIPLITAENFKDYPTEVLLGELNEPILIYDPNDQENR